jgi:hypothetical protein
MGFKEDIIRKIMNDSSRIIQEIVKQQGEIQTNATNILS